MYKKTLHKVILFGIAALFAGCAVLTVDVDVYKGPLANHEEVQTEQMAAMAIGAKPLLVLLRDTLEANYMRFLEKETRILKGRKLDDQSENYKKWGKMPMEQRLAKLRQQHWYRPEFVPEFIEPNSVDQPGMRSRFLDSNADHVNNVLSLYEDIDPNDVELPNIYAEIRDTINLIKEEYLESYNILRPLDMTEDKALARKIRDELEKMEQERITTKEQEISAKEEQDRSATKEQEILVKEEQDAPATKEQEISAKENQNTLAKKPERSSTEKTEAKEQPAKDVARSKLWDIWEAYEQFLCQDQRNAKKITKSIFTYLKDSSPQSLILKDLKSMEKPKRDALVNVTSAAHIFLAETEFVDTCADEVFGLEGDLKDQFVERVKQIARAYLKSRATLEHLWLRTMDWIVTIDNQQVSDDRKSKARTKFVVELAKMSLEIMQPRHLAVLLDAHNKKFISKDIDNLASSLEEYPSANPHQPHSMWDNLTMKYLLEKRLEKKPAETAKILIAIHQFCKSGLDPKETSIAQDVGKGDLRSLAYEEGWDFGLVQAPFAKAAPRDESEMSRSLWSSLFHILDSNDAAKARRAKPDRGNGRLNAGLETLIENYTKGIGSVGFGGGGFARGRLNDGLETLIEDYLNKSDACNPNDEELRWACKRLSDALVRFAQKLLFVANNKSLISPPESNRGLIPGTFNLLSRGLYGDKITESAADLLPGGRALLEDTDKHTRILQAVGNSILVQADALHQEKEHKKQLINHYKKEAAILADTVSKMTPVDQNTVGIKSIDEMLSENSPATAKDVRDLWITLLEYEHDLALHDGNEARADQIMEAIKAARAKREDMIFIRPAMAYLRTSFPATSLQGNPNLTWDNMLGGHMMRSIPFAPQIGEFLNPDAKRDTRITAEIDKQFWQNINRVRVAGGGNTNYAVVKDDIGNWYVKGYSSNPEDIIQSAQNLALFSAGGKMGTPSLAPSAPAGGPNQVRVTPGSTFESMLSEYEKGYREKTKQGYKLLYEIMSNSRNNIKKQIKDLWNANEDVNDKQTELETALDWSYTHFLELFAPEIKDNVKNLDKQREQIIEGIKRLRQFRNDLIWKITNVYSRDGKPADPNTPAGKVTAKSIVRNVVDSQIDDLLANRKDAIKTYENALMFLAEATKPQQQ